MNKIKRIHGKFKIGLILIRNIKNWPVVFLNYLGIIKNKDISIKLRDGKKVKIKKEEKDGETSGLASIYEIFFMRNYTSKGMEIRERETLLLILERA